jgi:hypothetical protein
MCRRWIKTNTREAEIAHSLRSAPEGPASSRFDGAAPVRRIPRTLATRLAHLHHDEHGTISILTVVTVIGLMMLLGLVLNVGRHIDDKVKMQNAADAATYSGGTVLARGMNSIAFTNHLLCDVFALTAFLREARDRNAEAMVSDILAAWAKIGPIFARSEFPKFRALGLAIEQQVPLEQKAVKTYGEMSAAISELVLPVFEYVLRDQLIPEFQRAIVRSIPELAQQTTNEVTRRHSLKQPKRPGLGMLWRTNAQAVGYPDENDPQERTLPAIDPTPGASAGQTNPVPDPHPDGLAGLDFSQIPYPQLYLNQAIMDRDRYSKLYLARWIADRMHFFDVEAKMSQYINLFRAFTGLYGPPRSQCGQLGKLLYEEYPNSNLPHVIRLTMNGSPPDALRGTNNQPAINAYLERNFMFVGIVYRRQFAESFGALFRNPLRSDPQTMTQVHLFIPRPRLWPPNTHGVGGTPLGGSIQTGGGGFGVDVSMPAGSAPAKGSSSNGSGLWTPDYGWSVRWNLFNQNWMVQLVPVVGDPNVNDNLARILQANPPQGAVTSTPSFVPRVPNLGGVTSKKIRRINGH